MSKNEVTRKFPKEALLEVIYGDPGDSIDGLVVVEQGGWIDAGKYSYRDTIFSYDGVCYEITLGRSGSCFSGYYYDSEDWDNEVECTQVEKVAVTKHEWRAVEATPDAS